MPRAVSTTARQPPQEEGREDPVTILITGFGPFLARLPRNSSWEIASQLPALLPATPENPTPIHIRVHHEPIRVAYQTVVGLVPKLLPPSSTTAPLEPDIIMHIGLAASRPFYTLEQGSHALGYGELEDVDGDTFSDTLSTRKFPSEHFPRRLETGFDTSDALTRWRAAIDADKALAGIKSEHMARISNDAGNFMCGFIYYNSLAHYHAMSDAEKGKEERPVVFLHVPDLTSSEEKLEEGRRVTIALIRALVASRKERGVAFNRATSKDANGDGVEGGVKARTDVNFMA